MARSNSRIRYSSGPLFWCHHAHFAMNFERMPGYPERVNGPSTLPMRTLGSHTKGRVRLSTHVSGFGSVCSRLPFRHCRSAREGVGVPIS